MCVCAFKTYSDVWVLWQPVRWAWPQSWVVWRVGRRGRRTGWLTSRHNPPDPQLLEEHRRNIKIWLTDSQCWQEINVDQRAKRIKEWKISFFMHLTVSFYCFSGLHSHYTSTLSSMYEWAVCSKKLQPFNLVGTTMHNHLCWQCSVFAPHSEHLMQSKQRQIQLCSVLKAWRATICSYILNSASF